MSWLTNFLSCDYSIPPAQAISNETELMQLGMDSLNILHFALHIAEVKEINFRSDEFGRTFCLLDIEKFLHSKGAFSIC
jgi:hypothetical protein